MNPTDLQNKIDHVSKLLATRLGAKGASLHDRINNRARALPRKVRHAARELAETEQILGAPKRVMQLDPKQIDKPYRTCIKYLEPLGAQTRFMQGFLRLVTGVVFIIVMTGAAMLAWAIAHDSI
ncbi:hypothetical protein ERN12_08730 [Rhodobacteraceae bacterium]|nr:hypothetical protein ERN12_08730 [Paracoccaceae bacterium]